MPEKLQQYQKRVISERNLLREDIRKLESFLNTGSRPYSVDASEEERLRIQATVMGRYLQILNERIGAWH